MNTSIKVSIPFLSSWAKAPLSIEISTSTEARFHLKVALEKAVKESANLYGANLYGANLYGANLYGANLRGANLRGANLYGADLRGANLRGADLYGADLRGADLYGANLRGADLYGANLRGANLRGANLRGADLYGADLRGAKNLPEKALNFFKADFWMILTQNPNEVPALIQALKDGRVNGSTYNGECACLVGTIANARGVNPETLERDSNRPAEQWFMSIQTGDKPGDDSKGGYAAGKALEWAEEWLAHRPRPIPATALTELLTPVKRTKAPKKTVKKASKPRKAKKTAKKTKHK